MTAKGPLVSAIIPTYNRAHIVCDAVESVLAQTYAPVEVIVVDDGSTDETLARLKRFGNRIRVIPQANAGPAAARNRGIADSRGELISFLDSDDVWLPSKTERQVSLMERAGESVSCCLCNCTIAYKDGSRSSSFERACAMPDYPEGLWLNPAPVLSTRFMLFNQGVMVRSGVLKRLGCFDDSLRFAEDYDLPLRLAIEGPWAIVRDELAVCYAANADSWGERALREEIRYREDVLRMWKRLLTICAGDSRHVGLRRMMRRRVRRADWDLRVALLLKSGSQTAALLGKSLRFAERVSDGLVRRSPFYPRVRVVDLN
jgi:glycosyltransferase involved in cell wall biosynthesis